ncbi:hypothetical protein EV174_003433, partial [Coemansia sp. RSA 2320]
CLLALCSSTYVGIRNGLGFKQYEIYDTACHQADPMFNFTSNEVAVSGYPTTYFANSDCTYVVGMAYHSNWLWQKMPRQVGSFSVLGNWN